MPVNLPGRGPGRVFIGGLIAAAVYFNFCYCQDIT
jgi:hypothetical protein